MKKFYLTAAAAALALGTAAPVLAQSAEATTNTALNVRSAPNVYGAVMGQLDANTAVTIEGCLEDVSWCRITNGEMTGWASGSYLFVNAGEQPVALIDTAGNAEVDYEINVISNDDVEIPADIAAAAAGGTVGALTAYALGGPIGAIALSAVGGAVAGDLAVELTEDSYVYVVENPVETVYLDGEVVVGAAVPADVTTYELPQPEYRYLWVNGVPVIVSAETNAIVAVLR